MRKPVLWSAVTFGVIALAGPINVSTSFLSFVGPSPTVSAPGATRFSSAYTALTKCGSGMTRKQEKEAEANGSDIPTRCKGYGGYYVYIYYSACSSNFILERGDETISLGMQAVNWSQKTVEWRMANGKPFAIIMRVYDYAGTNECRTDGRITGESLKVRGLNGFEHIDERVSVKGTPNPNAKAREIADKGYANTPKLKG